MASSLELQQEQQVIFVRAPAKFTAEVWKNVDVYT